MSADLDVLRDLRVRVQEAKGPDRELDYVIAEWVFGDMFGQYRYIRAAGDNGWFSDTPAVGARCLAPPQDYTSSIDATVALVEKRFPEWAHAHVKEKLRGSIGYIHNNAPPFVGIGARPNPDIQWFEQRAATPPLALIAALLTAEIARIETAAPPLPDQEGG